MKRLDKDQLIDESMRLAREFDRAVQRNPLLLRHIPAGSRIVLVSEEHPELTEYALAQAELVAEPNEPVVFLLADEFLQDRDEAN